MRKKLNLLVIFAAIGFQSYSQELISNAGESQTSTSINLTWSLGEMTVEEVSGGSLMLTQGFHQPSYTITKINDGTKNASKVKIYPNPVITTFYVDSPKETYNYLICDINGKIVKQGIIHTGSNKIDISDFSNSMYFLNLSNASKSISEKYRIVKQ